MSDFGRKLQREREARSVTLAEISASTKIGVRYLEALERDDLDSLPGAVFNRGYVRAYTQHLGVDPKPWIAAYESVERAQGRNDPDREALLRELSTAVDAAGETNRASRRRARNAAVLIVSGGLVAACAWAAWAYLAG